MSITAAIALLALLGAAFHPRVQTALVRDQLAPHLEAFELGRMHLLPWVLHIDDLALRTGGIAVELRRADIGLAPWRLPFGVAALRHLEVDGLTIDLRELPPGEESATAPPSLFALLEQAGWGIALGPLQAEAQVLLDSGAVLDLRLGGGGIDTETAGNLDFEVIVGNAAPDTRIELGGSLSVGQGEAGTFEAFEVDLLALVTAPALPEEDVLALSARATPIRVERPRADDPEERDSVVVGERLALTLTKPGERRDPLTLEVAARHDAEQHVLDGDFTLALNDALVTFYAPGTTLPTFVESARGDFALDLESLELALDYGGTTAIEGLDVLLGTREEMPAAFSLDKTLALGLAADTLTLRTLTTTLAPRDGDAVLRVSAATPLAVPLEAPQTLLDERAKLADVTVEGLPLTWVNGWLSDPVVGAGTLAASFTLESGDGGVGLVPSAPLTATVEALDERLALPVPISFSALPTLRQQGEEITLDLRDAHLAAADAELAGFEADLRLAPGKATPPSLAIDAHIDLDHVLALPLVAERLGDHALPAGLALSVVGTLGVPPGGVRVRALDARLEREGARPLLAVEALEPFTVALGEAGARLENPPGELARIVLDDIDLAWVSPFVPDLELAGVLDGATLALGAGAELRTLALGSRAPLRLRRVSVRDNDGVLVDALDVSVSASVDYAPDALAVRYSDLDVRLADTRLARARGSLNVPLGAADVPPSARADGHIEIDLAGLRELPQLTAVLADVAPTRRWRLDADYALGANAERIDVARLDAALRVDDAARVRVTATESLVVRPQIAAGEELARHFTGALDAQVDDLDSQLLADLLPLEALAFDALSVAATLRSDGERLSAVLGEPLRLAGVRLGAADAAPLHPFTITAGGRVEARGQRATATLDAFTLRFDARPEPAALAGTVELVVDPTVTVPLRRLDAALEGYLPVLLDQPAVLPGHSLRKGRLTLGADVDESGAIAGNVELDDLAADAPLAIAHITAEADGKVDDDGEGFAFRMPIRGDGRSGETDGLLVANYAPRSAANALLDLELTSQRFLLNDVLASIASIAGDAPAATDAPRWTDSADDAPATARSPDRTPDEHAFWDVLPYDARVRYHVTDLYYTDYVVFNDVQGEVTLSPTRFELSRLAARFHDSPLELDGRLDFLGDAGEPYELTLDGRVEEFDLNQFFSELVPGAKPRVEGLFSIDIDAFGTSPNMPEYRNELGFDLNLRSRDGLFRPLPPDSALMAGASDVLGIVGEGLSYMPTGGFGAGALSRLVNYIAVIDYDRIDIHVVRGDSRDIVIEQFLVQSPTINLTASGGIDYVDGVDILDSPLTLDASLNMSGKGAAILYSMDLLEDEKDAWGYVKGPSFRIRGTPAKAESNFAEIISTAADGTLKGGITRPISGLLGNIRYRWFGDTPDPYDDTAG
ncbi:MAG: hypothetical protein RKL32_11950 [Gammaproteobacteria bacterium]